MVHPSGNVGALHVLGCLQYILMIIHHYSDDGILTINFVLRC